MKSAFYQRKFTYNDQQIVVETNQIANKTEKSFVIRWNNSVILITVGVSTEKKDCNFLPLTVEFKENLYSAGKIPGGFFRREGKPSEYAILSARIIDRSIRNLFPKNFRNDIQIIINPLAVDYSIDIRVVALLATSLALNASSLPFQTSLAAVNVALVDNQVLFNPPPEKLRTSKLNLFVAGTKDKINMIEMDADQVSEEQLITILEQAHQQIQTLLKLQTTVLAELQTVSQEWNYFLPDAAVKAVLEAELGAKLPELLEIVDGYERQIALTGLDKTIRKNLQPKYSAEFAATMSETAWNEQLDYHFESLLQTLVRNQILTTDKRIDGRDLNTVRPINCQIDYLPIVHGSAVFNRGATQTLSTVTLGPISEQQIIDNLTEEESKCFMHHYNAPPFSIGIVAPMRGVSRREIGHGFLGEKALKRIMPQLESFPYTVRVVSEVLESNGSTSQAAICSSVLALLSAGVPIKNSIAGVAMGLIKKDATTYKILTDIQAWEDFYGDMDFKIAGSKTGICAIQLDLKIEGLPIELVKAILVQAKTARTTILAKMATVIAQPRLELAKNALKFLKLKIHPDEISLLIGPSGKNIKKIIQDTNNSDITIKDNGEILIYNKEQKMIDKVKTTIEGLFQKIEVDRVYEGIVMRIVDFGAFVKIAHSHKQGLIHISKMSKKFVSNIADILKVGDRVKVKVLKINELKKQISLELVAILNENE